MSPADHQTAHRQFRDMKQKNTVALNLREQITTRKISCFVFSIFFFFNEQSLKPVVSENGLAPPAATTLKLYYNEKHIHFT